MPKATRETSKTRRTPPGTAGPARRRNEQKSKSPEGAGRQTRSRSQVNPPATAADTPPGPQGSDQTNAKPVREGLATRSSDPRGSTGKGPVVPVKEVVYGGRMLQAEYESTQYPGELLIPCDPKTEPRLFVCDKCFKYTCDPFELRCHEALSEKAERPRGTLVHSFEGGRYQIYEVDGADQENEEFLQSMCLFGKFFIENKYIYYEFGNYLFYVLVEKSGELEHEFSVAGFFSKQKTTPDRQNLSCIVVFPPYRGGTGGALIDFSYFISKMTGRLGGPEPPVSNLGMEAYMKYWSRSIAKAILSMTETRKAGAARSQRQPPKTRQSSGKAPSPSRRSRAGDISIKVRGSRTITIEEISRATGILSSDIVDCLGSMEVAWEGGKPMFTRRELKEWSRGARVLGAWNKRNGT